MRGEQIILAAYPVGEPGDVDFTLENFIVMPPRVGEALCETIYLSLDPYMRGRISGQASCAQPVKIGDPIVGGTVGRVVASDDARFAVGDYVVGQGGWRSHWTASGDALRRLNPAVAPISTALGVMGMPGLTAYAGLIEIGRPLPGQTVVVSAASGAVGSVVGQIAKAHGCRVVGIAGGPEKCGYVVDELGFDACVDHRSPDVNAEMAAGCPDGIDVLFENVGGETFKTALRLTAVHARIIVCGFISAYNLTEAPPGPDSLIEMLGQMQVKRATMRGLLVGDFEAVRPRFLVDMATWIAAGTIRYCEDITDGLAAAPSAFQGLLRGQNFGKALVRVAVDPTR